MNNILTLLSILVGFCVSMCYLLPEIFSLYFNYIFGHCLIKSRNCFPFVLVRLYLVIGIIIYNKYIQNSSYLLILVLWIVQKTSRHRHMFLLRLVISHHNKVSRIHERTCTRSNFLFSNGIIGLVWILK